jgi:transcriptional/translational regulatory protein YebC/TACO1
MLELRKACRSRRSSDVWAFKWSSIKHQKGVTDAAPGCSLPTLEILLRRAGGPALTPTTGFVWHSKGRDSNMPLDNIQRGIARGVEVAKERMVK